MQRTPQECEIRWLGDRHPEFNRSPWTEPENTRVKELVGDLGQGEVDWVDIAAKLGVSPHDFEYACSLIGIYIDGSYTC